MSFTALHKAVTYLVGALGLCVLCLGPELDSVAEVVIALAVVGSWFVEGDLLHDPRWVRGWTIGLAALLVVQIVRGLLGASILSLSLEFTAVLMVSRLYNRRAARDYQQIGALALMSLIAATIVTSQVGYAFLFIGFLFVTPWTLALSHLRAEIETDRGTDFDDVESRERLSRVLASRSLVGPGFLLGTAALTLPLFLGTGLLFLFFPRVGEGFFGLSRESSQAVSGFGGDVELGDFGVIRTDPTVVLRVTPPDLPPDPPLYRPLRMRGTSFDHYDGRRWTRSRALGARQATRYDDQYALPQRLPYSDDQRWSMILDPLEESVIFFPPDAVSLEIPPRTDGTRGEGYEVFAAPGQDIRYEDEDGLGLRYFVYTSSRRRRRLPEPPPPETLRHYLQVPDGHERVAALAERWTAGAASDAERVELLQRHLRDDGAFSYSLETPRLDGRQPLDVFLFEARRGHCEYFATALAVLARTLGIPARNVTGFLGGRYNAYGGYYALAQGDAHSWVEVYLPDRGWVAVDPTPPARSAIAPERTWLTGVREVFDAIQSRWVNDVVGFNMRHQIEIFRSMRRWWWARRASSSSPIAPQDAAESTASQAAGGDFEGPAVVIFLVVLAVGALLWRLRGRRRREDPETRAARELYAALERALAGLGHPRPMERTPAEHLEALAAVAFPQLDLVRAVTLAHERARYGGRRLEQTEYARLLSEVRALGRGKVLSGNPR